MKLKYDRYRHDNFLMINSTLMQALWCTGFFQWDQHYLVWILSGYAKKLGVVILEEAP